MILRTTTAALGLGLGFAALNSRAQTRAKKVLFFTKSSGFEHSVIKRVNGQPSFAEKILTELGPKHGIDFTFSKDGSLFTPDYPRGLRRLFLLHHRGPDFDRHGQEPAHDRRRQGRISRCD